MSLAINVSMVTEVLLVDGWIVIEEGSFEIGPYEYQDGTGMSLMYGGNVAGVVSEGYRFAVRQQGKPRMLYQGPLSAVLGVKIPSPTGKD